MTTIYDGYYLLDHHRNRDKDPGPAGEYDSRPWYTTRRDPVQAIVIHTPETLEDFVAPYDEAERVAAYGANTTRASWHDTIDADSIIPMLPGSYTAWQVRGHNSNTLGMEIGATARSWDRAPTKWVDGVLRNAAIRGAQHAKEFGIPPVLLSRADYDRGDKGFIGHAPLDPTRRTDPGLSFPWSRYLSLVQQNLKSPIPTNPPMEEPMTLAEARLEVARIWAKALGSWPTGTSTESAQQRLTRLASRMVNGELTTGELFAVLEPYAPADLAERRRRFFENKSIPAWILTPGIPDTYSGEAKIQEVARLPKSFRATITVDDSV